MAVTIDQASLAPTAGSTGTGSAGVGLTNLTFSTSGAVASGAMIVLLVHRFRSGGGGTYTGTGGSLTWTTVHTSTNGNIGIYLICAFAPSGLASGTTIGVNSTVTGNDYTVTAASYLGVDTSGTVSNAVRAIAASSGSGTSWTTTAITGALSGDAIIGGAGGDGTLRTSTPGGDAVERDDFNSASSSGSITLVDDLNGEANDTLTGTWSGTLGHVTVGAAFKPAAGGTNATVNAVIADGTGDLPNPAVTASSNVLAPPCDATGDVLATVAASSNINAPAADATGDTPNPALSASSTVVTPAADGTGDTPAPTLSAGANILAPPLDGTGDIAPPTVTAGGSSTVTATVADATGDIPAPTISASSNVAAAPCDATGDLQTPTVSASGNTTVTAVPADATGDLPAPALTWTANVQATPAQARGTLVAPAVIGSLIPDLDPIRIQTRDRNTRASHQEHSKATYQDSAHLVLREQR